MRSPALFIVCFMTAATAIPEDRPVGLSFATRSEIIAPHGMAATSQPLATQVALDILKAGGTALDAALAANAMQGLVEPASCGIGGDLFAIVWDAKKKKLHGLNASGRSPRSLTLDHFRKLKLKQIPEHGPLPISVPGCVDGWFLLHQRFGKLPMKQILQPAIDYGEAGFPLSEVIAAGMAGAAKSYKQFPGFSEVYLPGGRLPVKGQMFKNPALAKTYRALATRGRDTFYKGVLAKAMAAFVQKHGGFLTVEDLATHTSEWVEPVSTTYRGYRVWELPPNGQGIAALQMLNLLEGFDLKKMGYGSPGHVHAFVEAKKLVFEDRAKFYSDPAFNRLPVRQLISKPYAEKRRMLIDPKRAAKRPTAGAPGHGDTIYLTVADRHGNMVSLIQSNYYGFGSGLTPPTLGFSLQNRGALFTLEEGHFNVYAPRKRPFHTIIPAFVTKAGKPWLSFGVMGGDMQPQGHVQILMNLIDFGMNLQEAGDAPRIRHFGNSTPRGDTMAKNGGTVRLETGFPAKTITALRNMGHTVEVRGGGHGGYQAILWDAKNKVYYGASESRKDGQAAGY
ncbi:MAG: gamma-glutamyltransferase [Verrucomicrobiota bacterium]|nr:gamma-glutamyltransferase [Verrucomicrobiota bacterium]